MFKFSLPRLYDICKNHDTNEHANQVTHVLPNKDPKDYTLTESSTAWERRRRIWCTACNTEATHKEFGVHICNTCGAVNSIESEHVNQRKIYIDGKWLRQIRLRNGEEIIEEI